MEKIDSKHITAAEAKDRLREKLFNSEGIQRFMEKVERTIDSEVDYFNFTGDLSDTEIKYLDSLGYDICWNSPCLWYEVNFKL